MGLVKRNGRWVVRRKVAGKDRWTSTGFKVADGKTAKNAAQRRLSELNILDQGGELGWTPTPSLTFLAWWETYRAVHLKEKAETTQRRDTGTMTHHALPFFGQMLMGEIRKSDCMRYLEERRNSIHANDGHLVPKPTSEGTVQRERRFLQAFWQQAIEDGHDIPNPWRGIDRVNDAVRDRVLTVEEQALILPHLSPSYQRLLLVFIGTGIRLDELRGINQDTDIDWTQRLLTVTGKGDKTRQVPLASKLIPLLQAQLAENGQLWKQNPQRIREVFADAATKAGIPHVSPHTFRHTFGTRWLQGKGDIYKLSRVLGHASVKVTEDHYAHLLKEDLRAAADELDLGL